MAFELTHHARFEIGRRQIPEQLVMAVLEKPEQVVTERGGLVAYQSRVIVEPTGEMLVRVIVDERARPPRVITVYLTSKIEKYWRQP
jgi:hypothetical protein